MMKSIERDRMNNKFNKAILVFVVSVLMIIQLPYSDQTIPMILIPNIPIGSGGVLMLSGIIPLAGFIWSFSVFNNSERIKMNGLLFFVLYLAVFIPATTHVLEYTKWPLYSLAQGCNSIEVTASELNYRQMENESVLSLELEIKGYRDLEDGFQVAILIEGQESEDLLNYKALDEVFYISRGVSKDLIIDIPLDFKDSGTREEFFAHLYKRNYTIRLYNEESSREYIRHSIY